MPKKPTTAVIGGSGLSKMASLKKTHSIVVETPYGNPSSEVVCGELNHQAVSFLARHGIQHSIAPHKINYRANIWALKHLGIKKIIAVAAVGGINENIKTGSLVIPDQLLDYTHGREHSFFDGVDNELHHIDFSYPYSPNLRESIINIAHDNDIAIVDKATYVVTQGPRLETAIEIKSFQQLGGDIVGMTSMPEAALARELELDYICIALVVNPAAGLSRQLITIEQINEIIEKNMIEVIKLINCALPKLNL